MVFSLQILGAVRPATRAYGLAGLVVASSLLAACGQKGPLYLASPPPLPPPALAPAASTAEPAAPPVIAPSSAPARPASAAR